MEKIDVMEGIENTFYVVAVKDELTQTFMNPTFGDNLDALKRIFFTQIKTVPIWRENPTDFSLYLLGTFNQSTGELNSHIEKITSGYINKMEEQ